MKKMLFIIIFPSIALGGFFISQYVSKESVTSHAVFEHKVTTLSEDDTETADGTKLHYWFYDRGTDYVLVYLHGGPGSNSSAIRTAYGERLSNEIGSILFFDQRGSGESDAGDASTYTFPVAIEDMKSVIEAVASDKKIILWGHSFGGTLAAMNATSVDGIKPIAYILDAPWLNEAMNQEARASMPEDAFAISKNEHDLMNAYKVMDTNGATQRAWYMNENLNTRDFLPLLEKIGVPVLVISGDSDTNITPAQIGAMRPHLPNATYIEIPDAAHNLIFSHPDEFMSTLKDFLASL